MAVIATVHAVAAIDARQPRLSADEAGIRIRAGRAWFGLDWPDVERVDVRPARRIGDGTVAVVARSQARPRPDRWRDRWSLRRNRWRYDSELCIAYGLLTTMDVPDLPRALGTLAGGRLQVIGIPTEAPSTVEVTVAPSSRADADADTTNRRPPAEAGPARPVAGGRSIPFHSRRRTGRRTDLAVVVDAPTTAPIGAATASTGGPDVAGSLALDPSQPAGDRVLPEVAELRRLGVDNVSLIIDETTAVTARAISMARGAPTDLDPGTRPGDLRSVETGAVAPRRGPSTSRDGSPDHSTEQRGRGPATDLVAPPGIGAVLEHARTVLGVSVDDLAERTRIRPHVIECLERDDMSVCGGDVYARGHLRMLAQSLGLDPQPMVERYDATFASEPIRVRDVFDAELSTTGLVRSGDARPRWDILVAVVVVLALGWTGARYLSGDASAGRPVGIASHPRGPASPGVGSRLLPGPPRVAATLRAEGGTAHVVVVDRYGQRVFTGELVLGQVRHVAGVAPLRIRASDGSVVALTVHGKRRGLLAPVSTDAYGRRIPTPVRTTVRVGR
jgi:hypothetical protein